MRLGRLAMFLALAGGFEEEPRTRRCPVREEATGLRCERPEGHTGGHESPRTLAECELMGGDCERAAAAVDVGFKLIYEPDE